MRVAIYCRQSDSSGAGLVSLSLESQEAELRARAEREGWHVVTVEREADLKGYQDETERPAFNRLLDAAGRGELDILLVWDVSRLARLLEYQERWIRILSRMGVEVESHTEPEVRQSTLIRQIKGAVAEERTREIQKHVRRAMRSRAEAGLTHGPPPYGYTRASKSPLVPDPATAPYVLEAYRRRAAGASVEEVRLYLESVCRPPRAASWRWLSVHQMLANPVYLGTVVSGPVTREHAHPAIVTPELWHAAQALGHRHNTRAAAADLSWLAGCVDHACGRRMHLIAANSSHPGPYFRCNSAATALAGPRTCWSRPSSVSARKTERAAWPLALAALDRLARPSEILAAARRHYRETAPDAGRERRAIEQQLDRLAARRSRAEDLYLTGARDRAWFAAEDARMSDELAALEARLAALPQLPDPADIDASIARLRSLRDAAATLTPAQRGALIALLGRVIVGDGPIRLALDPAIERLLTPETGR